MTTYMPPLRDLKRAAARRTSQQMAVVLCKKCNTADVRFRARPAGLTVRPALIVTASRQAPDMSSKLRRDCGPDRKPEAPYKWPSAPSGYASLSSAAPNHARAPRASAILGKICGLGTSGQVAFQLMEGLFVNAAFKFNYLV